MRDIYELARAGFSLSDEEEKIIDTKGIVLIKKDVFIKMPDSLKISSETPLDLADGMNGEM